jgi:glutathione S-transferase
MSHVNLPRSKSTIPIDRHAEEEHSALYCQKVLIAFNELGLDYRPRRAARFRPRRAGRARRWDRLCDQYISDCVQAIVFDTIEERFDEHAVARARGRIDMAYGMLEAQLTQHEFLADDRFTIAECAAAPGLFFALAINPWAEDTHPQLTRYYRALAQRPSFAKVVAGARPYRHLFPLPWPADFDRYH